LSEDSSQFQVIIHPEVLIDNKFEVREASDDVIYADNEDFLVRVLMPNKIQLAARKYFDRWGNSTDFEFLIPRTAKTFQAKLQQAHDMLVAGKVNKGGFDTIRL